MRESSFETVGAASFCRFCGNDCGGTCEGAKKADKSPESAEPQAPELTREQLARMKNLEIKVQADFEPVLTNMRAETSANLQPRPEGFHITIIGPTESKVLKNLDDAHIAELQEISKEIQLGEGVAVQGIGFIDGSGDTYKMRDVDTTKKTTFVAVDIPRLQAFREKVGLPPKDLHVTLGFESGDIHMHVTGTNDKGKEIRNPIPKKADERFGGIPLPDMQFGTLSGEMKPEKKKKQEQGKKEKKEKRYNYDILRASLTRLVEGGSKTGFTADMIDSFIGALQQDPKSVGRSFGKHMREIGKLMSGAEEKD